MAATGGKHLAGSFRDQFAAMKQKIDELHLDMAAAMTEFSDAVAHGSQAVTDIRTEAAEMRAAFAQNSNDPPAGPAEKPAGS